MSRTQESPPWWHGAVIYQLYVRSWRDSDDDGYGDLRGIIERLDYLSWLGVDAIWLSPTMPSPDVDWGYDVSDYMGVHPELGTMADLDELIAKAGQRTELRVDAGVVADVVAPVVVRGRHGRRQPDGVHPEPGQVIQALDDAAQVAVPVTVAVPPGPHVQLVNDGAVPPQRARLRSAHVPPNHIKARHARAGHLGTVLHGDHRP